MKRMNLGAGSIHPPDWINVDVVRHEAVPDFYYLDMTNATTTRPHRDYDYIVANHVISCIDHHGLAHALANVRAMLKPGGWFRILVPDAVEAFRAYLDEDEGFFPQDERTGGLDAKFCTFLTWFGESKSVFTYGYLLELLHAAGFSDVSLPLVCHETISGLDGITDLDDRCTEALIVEAQR